MKVLVWYTISVDFVKTNGAKTNNLISLSLLIRMFIVGLVFFYLLLKTVLSNLMGEISAIFTSK